MSLLIVGGLAGVVTVVRSWHAPRPGALVAPAQVARSSVRQRPPPARSLPRTPPQPVPSDAEGGAFSGSDATPSEVSPFPPFEEPPPPVVLPVPQQPPLRPLPRPPTGGTPLEPIPPTGEQDQEVIGGAARLMGAGGILVNGGTSGNGQGDGSGGDAGGGGSGGGGPGPEGGEAPSLVVTSVKPPQRFREIGVPIGDAVDVQAKGTVTFPLRLTLTFDPREPQAKGVPPDLIQAFFFNAQIGTWSTDGLQVNSINVSDGVVAFDTTHLTVFRLGVPRGRPPLIHQARPHAVGPGGSFGVWGLGFSLPASQNIITLGGAFVTLALDQTGLPQPLNLNDSGETLSLLDAQGQTLEQASLSAAPVGNSSWTRQTDADANSAFLSHATVATGRLFSPGTMANGDPFAVTRGNLARPPQPGELVINEALLAPPNSFLGDANGDGETNLPEDEFVELVNTTDHPLELGGCRLVTQAGERHRFPEGTQLPGGMAFVIFGVDDPSSPPQPAGSFGGRRVFPDLSGEARLIARSPADQLPGTDFLAVTTFRQTSNPMTFQFLAKVVDRLPAFEDHSATLGPVSQLSLRMLRAGDLDRDLDVDLAALTGNAEIVLISNDGFGGFTELVGRLTLPAGRNRFFDLALADLTEDGAPELIIGDTDAVGSYTQLIVFANTGGGFFELASQNGVLNSPASSGPTALDVADLDDDGDLDVVVAMIGDQPILFRNDGSSHFTHQPAVDVVPQTQVVVPSDLQLADVDGDGDLDLLLSAGKAGLGTFSDLQLFLNTGGQFADMTAARLPLRSEGLNTFAVGDVDGDADLDVVSTSALVAPRLYRNDGTGTFSLVDASALAAVQAASVSLADFDGDGDLDLVFSLPPRDQVYLNDGTGTFTALSPLPAVSGDHHEVAAADVDNDGDLDLLGAGSLTLLLNIGTRANHPPTIDAVADQPVVEGDALAVNVTAHDADEDTLTLTAALLSGDPLSTIGASFTDHGAGQGTVNWTPGFDQGLLGGKLYEVVVKAHDGSATASRTIRIFVHNFNHAPTLQAIAPRTVDELEPLSIQLQAQDEDVGDVLTFGSVNKPTGSSLNSSSGLFEWTPGPTQGDSLQGFVDYPVTFTVTDLAHATDEEDVIIRVLHRNHAPIFTPVGSQTVAEGQLLQLVLAASDRDGDPVTVSDVVVPDGATFDDATSTFRWTPDFTQARAEPYLARFVATDQEFSTPLDVAITVLDTHVNQPPVLTPIDDRTVREGDLLQFAIQASDPDGDVLAVTVDPLPVGAQIIKQGALFLFQWVPGMDQSGTYALTFTVSDGTLQVVDGVTITVQDNPGFQRLVAQVGFVSDGGGVTLSHDAFHAQQAQEETSFHATQEAEETAFHAEANAAQQVFRAGLESLHTAEHADLDEVRQQLLNDLLTGDPAADAVIRAFVDQFITAAHDQGVHAALEALHTFGHRDDPALDAEFHAIIDAGHQAFHDDIASGAIADELHAFVHTSTSPVIDSAIHTVLDGAVDAYHTGGIHAAMAVLDGAVDAALAAAHETFHAQQQAAHDAAHAEQTVAHTAFHVAIDSGSSGLPFGDASFITWGPGSDLIMDLGEVHPALVSMIELFNARPAMGLGEADLGLFVSDDNAVYRPYEGPRVLSASANRLIVSNLNIAERYIKIHRLPASDPDIEVSNFLPQLARASGAIPLDAPTTAFLDDLEERTFRFFLENVNEHGLIPDRVMILNGDSAPGTIYSTAATGFWLASLPIAAERGWITHEEAQQLAARTLKSYLGIEGAPVAGEFGFFYHFLNGDGTRFTEFEGDGVSIIDSVLLFSGALACGSYFDGEVQTLAQQLYDQADWDAFFDHAHNQLRLFWTPEQGFIGQLDYYSEGLLAYLLAAGSTTHPIVDPDLPSGADAYYAFSQGNFGRVLGRFGREGRPLLQSFFGSLFTYLMPPLFIDLNGVRDAFHINWEENTREAILANFRFAQTHTELGYSRLFWGISASDGPAGYQGRYGTPPLDPGSGGVLHDGTIAPYALAGSLPFAADLALPALQHVRELEDGRLFDRYGLKDAVNVHESFFASDYLGIDQGMLLLGAEHYRTRLVAQLVRQHPAIRRAIAQLGFRASGVLLERIGPRSAHAYLFIDTTDHLTQTITIDRGDAGVPLAGDALLELHPFGMDTALGERFVDVEVAVNGAFLKTVRFVDRRGSGVVDVGSVYVPISASRLHDGANTISLTWLRGERWLQLEDVELREPTGRIGSQETWQIGEPDGTFHEFGEERLVDNSYLVGDDPATFEQALNAVVEPTTDILFELNDAGTDRLLRLVASQTQNAQPVTVEIRINDAVADHVTLTSGAEATLAIPQRLLRLGWNHLVLRHAQVLGNGEFILWDTLAFESQTDAASLQVLVRNVADDQLASEVHFGLAPAEGAILSAGQYLEISFEAGASFDRLTIATNNRNAPIHRFTGPAEASAAGLVGTVDSGITAPLLWQVYDEPQPTAPVFTNTTEWAFVSDMSEPSFDTMDATNFRSLIIHSELGPRPSPGRSGSSPIAVYFVADFKGKPAQTYGTDRLTIERFEQ